MLCKVWFKILSKLCVLCKVSLITFFEIIDILKITIAYPHYFCRLIGVRSFQKNIAIFRFLRLVFYI